MHSKEIEEYKSHLTLSPLQREVLVGTLLGDACLETQNGRTYRVKLEQSLRHAPYINHLYDLFRGWCLQPPQVKKAGKSIGFSTVSHGAFRFYAYQFYREKRKVVPKLIHRWLTPRAFAYWYMDDGSIKSRESKGVILNTQGFQRKEVQRLAAIVSERFQLQAKERKQKEGYQIYISGYSYERFIELVEPYVLSSMRYKIPDARKTELPKE